MRHSSWLRSLGLATAFATLVVLGGCNRTDTAAPKANTTANDPDQVLKNQTADVEQKTNAELNDWDRRIDQLKTAEARKEQGFEGSVEKRRGGPREKERHG